MYDEDTKTSLDATTGLISQTNLLKSCGSKFGA
jgi:hypothetical protein